MVEKQFQITYEGNETQTEDILFETKAKSKEEAIKDFVSKNLKIWEKKEEEQKMT